MKRYLISAALFAAVGFSACDGNDETNPTDTTQPDTSDTSDTTQPDTSDTTQPDTTDTIAPPDTIEPSATVKYARTLVAQEPCSADFRNDIDPQSQLADVIVTTPVYEITAPAAEDPGSYGFYVADADGGAYSGILVVTDGPKPELAIGNVVDVSGQLMEAFCNAQVSNATVTKKSDGTLPTPLTQNAADLSQDAYEGMLVKVVDAEIEAATEGGQGKRIKGANLPIGFVFEGFIGLNNGTTYDITGVIRSTRFNGVEGFQLVPRGPSDVVLKNATTALIADIQSNTDSKDCTLDTSAECPLGSGTSCINFFEDYTLTGVVMSEVFTITDNLNGFFLATEGSQAPFSGVLVNGSSGSSGGPPALIPLGAVTVGDTVLIAGAHNEYFCHTQFRANSVTKTGTGTAVNPLNIDGQSDLEQFEGMLVELTNVTVTGDDGFGAATTDKVVLIDKAVLGSAFAVPATNAVIPTLRGFLTYSFSKHRISPRSAADYATN